MALLFAVTPLSGTVGWALCTYLAFVALDYFDNYRTHGVVVAKDRVATVLIATAGLCTVVPLILIVIYVVSQGLGGITKAFFTETLEASGRPTRPRWAAPSTPSSGASSRSGWPPCWPPRSGCSPPSTSPSPGAGWPG